METVLPKMLDMNKLNKGDVLVKNIIQEVSTINRGPKPEAEPVSELPSGNQPNESK